MKRLQLSWLAAAPWELYRLDQDLAESYNLASTQSKKLQDLRATWQTINAEMAGPVRW